jgi:hypothetical protein
MKILNSGDDLLLAVTIGELQLMASSIGEALELIEEWEFHPRLGAEPAAAEALLDEMNQILVKFWTPE